MVLVVSLSAAIVIVVPSLVICTLLPPARLKLLRTSLLAVSLTDNATVLTLLVVVTDKLDSATSRVVSGFIWTHEGFLVESYLHKILPYSIK